MQLLSSQQIPTTQVSNMMPTSHMRKRTSSPPHSPVDDEPPIIAQPDGSPSPLDWPSADGQPFQLYQSRPLNERSNVLAAADSTEEPGEEEGEEDNISEMMMNTMLQSTHRSARNPIARFNESHPTQ